MKANALAEALGYAFIGPPETEVTGVAYAAKALGSQLAAVSSYQELSEVQSGILLMEPMACLVSIPKMVTHESLELSMVRVAEALIAAGDCPDYRLPSELTACEGGAAVGRQVQIGVGCHLGYGAIIEDGAVLGDGCRIGAHTVIHRGVCLASGVSVGCGSEIGAPAFFRYRRDGHWRLFGGIGTVRVGEEASIGSQVIIQRGAFSDTRIGAHTLIGSQVELAHDVEIGQDCVMVSQTGVASDAVLEDEVTVFGRTGISNRVRIGRKATVLAHSGVAKDVPAHWCVSGDYSLKHTEHLRLLAQMRMLLNKKKERR